MKSCLSLRAVVLDWAGTMVDYGSRAPALVFQEVFHRRGVDISVAQAREPMGMAKREHIAAIAASEQVAAKWSEVHGGHPNDDDVEAMYVDFLPLQMEVLREHCKLIPGARDAAVACREMGLKIGSTTGYTRELMEIVGEEAANQGYVPDCILCAEDAPKGRPAPYLLFEVAKRLDVYPMHRFVKVDDTAVGIEAGRNAGCWTVGITKSGNGVGLSLEEAASMDPRELADKCRMAEQRLREAGAHFVIESVRDLPMLLQKIDSDATAGALPLAS